MKTNKLHTHTYIQQLLQKVYILFVLLLCLGCQNETDEYVLSHTETIIKETYKDYIINIHLEKEKDLYLTSITPNNLLLAEEVAYNITKIEEIKNTLIYIPTNYIGWAKFNATGGYIFDDCGWKCILAVHVSDTEMANFIVAINPEFWQSMTHYELIKIFLHELTHEISRRIDNNEDIEHTKIKYWDKEGLLEAMLQSYISTVVP